MEKRMLYRTYKKAHPDAPVVEGSWDPETKTVVVRLPDNVKHLKFSPKEWGTNGQTKWMRDHHISIICWGSGANAHFYLEAFEAHEDPEFPGELIKGLYHATNYITHDIPGYGPNARDAAIQEAKDLAATGKYCRKFKPLF